MNKKQLRHIFLEQRKKLSRYEVKAASDKIISLLMNHEAVKDANLIMSYMPYGNEVDILPLNQWLLEQGKSLCLPRVIDDSKMDAVLISSLDRELEKSRFGIWEPSQRKPAVDPKDIDVILVPGLAFDREGNRLGHGRGYYDRFLDECPKSVHTIGIAYPFQLLDSIPADSHDRRVKEVISG